MAIADPSKRLQAIPPYMFQELERRIEEKRAAGIDVISLGIGDPDMPTYDVGTAERHWVAVEELFGATLTS